MANELRIYKASAGSGKTFSLTRQYLLLLFRDITNYKRILAVTFTNKAAGELKARVLQELVFISSGNINESQHFIFLQDHLQKETSQLVKRAKKILRGILFEYGLFSIGTIDEFFQTILRSFTREIGLFAGYEIELNVLQTVESAVEQMISQFEPHDAFGQWMIESIAQHIDQGESWKKFERKLVSIGLELLREEIASHYFSPKKQQITFDDLVQLQQSLWRNQNALRMQAEKLAAEVQTLVSEASYDINDFIGRSRGPVAFLLKFSVQNMNPRKMRDYADPDKSWISKGKATPYRDQVADFATKVLRPKLLEAIDFFDRHQVNYMTSGLILENLPALSFAAKIAEEIIKLGQQQNRFLLSLTNPLITQIVADNPVSFVYEKTGIFYDHYMIDEFQDTSELQWKNFIPLINNSLASGKESLLVGDVKQSVYRWRNSKWQIMAYQAKNDIIADKVLELGLAKNFRSRTEIIDFNNQFFEKAHQKCFEVLLEQVERNPELENDLTAFEHAYDDVRQEAGRKAKGGYVEICFVPDESTDGFPAYFQKLLDLVVDLQKNKGYQAGDIVFLVRTKKEGARLVDFFAAAPRRSIETDVSLELVSSESFRLGNSGVLRCIVAMITLKNEPDNPLYLGQLAIEYQRLKAGEVDQEFIENVSKIALNVEALSDLIQVDLQKILDQLVAHRLAEAIELVVEGLELNLYPGAAAYIIALKEYIAAQTVTKSNLSLLQFSLWWQQEGCHNTVVMDDGLDAMRVMTVHKAKGLEFPVVILPQADWSLDHQGNRGPYLWLEYQDLVNEKQALLPIKYKKDLLESSFASAYAHEKIQVYFDNLNLLYVAFTRATDCLYAFVPSKTAKRSDQVSGLIHSVLSLDEIDTYYFGDPDTRKLEVNQDTDQSELLLNSYPTGSAQTLHTRVADQISDSVLRGKMIHELLSSINRLDEVEEKVAAYLPAFHIENEELESISQRIIKLLSEPRIAAYFSQDYQELNETGFLVPGKGEQRPDRVAIREQKAVVLEYKTGQKKRLHIDQIKSYMKTLQKMNYKEVLGYLIYFDSLEIIEVD